MLSSPRKNNVTNWLGQAPRRRPDPRLMALLIGTAFCLPAMAEISDTIHPFISYDYGYDDNLLRQTKVAGFDQDLSDSYHTVEGGILFERPISRQYISGHAKLSRTTFDRNDQLDYNGKDLLVNWDWQLGNHLQGDLGTSYVETLTPFTDTQSDQRNLRTQKKSYFDGKWRFHPSWQVRGGFTRTSVDYDLVSQQRDSRTEDQSEFGFDYLAPSGSTVGLVGRHLKADYDQLRQFGLNVVDNGFEQDEIKVNVLWELSGITKLTMLAGYVRRKHERTLISEGSENSGANGRLTANWQPLGKVSFNGSLWREFAVVEGGTVGSSLNKGASVGTTWNATAKIRVDGQLQYQKRDFESITAVAPESGLQDTSKKASLGLTYSPLQRVQLGLSAFHDQRSGSILAGTNTYKANGISFNANAQF